MVGFSLSLRGVFFFFFQAEDGIRDKLVTGVQTCALPIFTVGATIALATGGLLLGEGGFTVTSVLAVAVFTPSLTSSLKTRVVAVATLGEIGRASCRERG